jgi:lipopolysaccharide assembly outer membrane protein LptD (OstA)
VARFATIIAALFIAVGWSTNLAAAADRVRMDEPFEISADRITYDGERDLYVAEGHVRVDQVGRRLKARWVAFSTSTRIGVAEGEVDLEDGEDRLRAEFMVFDVDTLRGMLFQGSMNSGDSGFKVRAKELIRTGENTFTVRDGVFTTCRCEPGERLPWEIHAQKADVELGGYGTITNSTFNVLGVPVLWIPWAFFPMKSDRETGLLLPEISFGGRSGSSVGLPFFWAARPQLNVTLTPHYFSKRGYKQDVEFEYVLGERSEGELFLSGVLDDSSHEGGDTFRRRRWAILWEHDQELPAKWRWQTDLNLSSDNLYAADFLELREYKAFRFLESTSNVARNFGSTGGFGAMFGARYADELQGSSLIDRDRVLLQRWAEARADIAPGTLRGPYGIEARVDLEYIYFGSYRQSEDELGNLGGTGLAPLVDLDGRFADVGLDGRVSVPSTLGEGDMLFQPGEPIIERGSRMILHPRISKRFRLGGLAEFTPEVGWQQTLYRTNAQDFAERGLFTARGDLRSRLFRDYFGVGNHRAVRHVIEPRLSWAFVSAEGQKDNPLFVPRGSVAQSRLRAFSLENVTRNPSDRIDNVNQLVLSLGQRMFVRNRPGSAAKLRAELLAGVDWDFTGQGGLGNLYLEGRLFPARILRAHARGAFDLQDSSLEEGEVGADLRIPGVSRFVRRASVGATYRYRRDLPRFAESVRGRSDITGTGDTRLSQLDGIASVELTERLRLRYRATYSFVDGGDFIRSRGALDYVSKCRCWGIGLSAYEERDQNYGGGIEIRILGLGKQSGSLFNSGLGIGQNF